MALADTGDYCLCAESNCLCNSQLVDNCTCSSPRCAICSGLLGPRAEAATILPTNNIYEAIPRTASRVFSNNTIWGTATAHFRSFQTEGAPCNTFAGFVYLAIPVPPRLKVDVNARAQANLPNVPFTAIMRHNQNIIAAEAAINHSLHRKMVISRASAQRTIGRDERQLISSASEWHYVLTPNNTPQQRNPRVATTSNGEGASQQASYGNHYFGGGKITLKKRKGQAKKSPWENENLMAEDSSFLYDQKHRKKIRALFEHPAAKNIAAESSLHGLPVKNAQRAVETFQSDGICRFNDPEFVAEAIGASERRTNGEFDDYEDSQFNDTWRDSDSASEYDDDVEMTSSEPVTHGIDDTSDEREIPRQAPIPVIQMRRSVGGFDGADDRGYHEEQLDESEDDEVLIPTRVDRAQHYFHPRRDDEDDDTNGGGLRGLSNANTFSDQSFMRQPQQRQANNDNQEDGQRDRYGQKSRQSLSSNHVFSNNLSTPSPPSSMGLLPANRYMLTSTSSELKFEVLYYIKNFKGKKIIQPGDTLRFAILVGDKKDKEEISKDVLLLGFAGQGVPRTDGSERPKGIKIAIPPDQHARSEPHLRKNIEFPNDERPTVIYGTSEMVKCLHTLDPKFKKIANVSWKKITVIRNGENLGTLWDIRNAYNFLQNELDFEGQLNFTQIRQRRISEVERKEGYEIVGKATGLYRKIRKDDYILYNHELLIDLGDELNGHMSALAEPEHMIVMVDMRMLISDGITGPDCATFENIVRLGPNVYPTAFTRELAGGSKSTWSLGHAHIGPLGLGWAAGAHVDPHGVPMHSWEKEAVASFHDAYVYEKIKHFPLPINRARKLHCGSSSRQYKKGADGVSWTLDVNGPFVIGTGVPTIPLDGREGLCNNMNRVNIRALSRAVAFSYDTDSGSLPSPELMPTFGSIEQDASARHTGQNKDKSNLYTAASFVVLKEAAHQAATIAPAQYTPPAQYMTPQQFAQSINSANQSRAAAQSSYSAVYKSASGYYNSPYSSSMVTGSLSTSPFNPKTAHSSDVPEDIAKSMDLDLGALSDPYAYAYLADAPHDSSFGQNIASATADIADSDFSASIGPYASPFDSMSAYASFQDPAPSMMRPSSVEPWKMEPAYSPNVSEFVGQPVQSSTSLEQLEQEFHLFAPPYGFDPRYMPEIPRFFGQPPQIVFPCEFEGYEEHLAKAPVPSDESAPIHLGHSSTAIDSSQTGHQVDPILLTTQPPRQKYQSPPLGGLNGNFFQEHEQHYALPPPQALPQEQNVCNFKEGAVRGSHLDWSSNRDNADLIISDLLIGQIASKRSSLRLDAIDGRGKRLPFADNGDIDPDLSATPVKRGRGRPRKQQQR